MKKSLVLFLLLLSGCTTFQKNIILEQYDLTELESLPYTKIEFSAAYPIDGPKNFEPSGLTLVNGRLYAVSDKHSENIFEIVITNNTAVAIDNIQISYPLVFDFSHFDFEGITHDLDGNFYVVDEYSNRILKISSSGTAEFYSESFFPSGRAAGLFSVDNAGAEGIIFDPNNQIFSVLIEREPRGIVEFNTSTHLFNGFNMQSTSIKLPFGRNPDFSDGFLWKNKKWILGRNSETIFTLSKSGIEENIYYFGHITNLKEYEYIDNKFGLAEGLAIDDKTIYIILDNNGQGRKLNNADKRPLLLVFKNNIQIK